MPCGFAHFPFLKEGWQAQNKTKIKPLFGKILTGILPDESVPIDEMILNILKEPKGENGSAQRRLVLPPRPSSE